MSQTQNVPSDRELLEAIYESCERTRRYAQWQLYITVALVVLPLLAAVVFVPILLSNVLQTYSSVIQ